MTTPARTAADPGLPDVTPRGLLAAGPALGLAAAPAFAAAPETEVMRLFREWDASQAGWANVPLESDEAGNAYCWHCEEIVKRVVAAPCETAGDLAAKIVAVCGWIGSSEVADARARLRRAVEVEVDGHGRFLPWDPDSRTAVRLNALGYRRQPDEAMTNDPPTFFVHASGMAELLAGLDRKTVLEELADEGVIVRHEVMAKGEKVLALTRVFKVLSEKSARRLYQLDHGALMREPGDGNG